MRSDSESPIDRVKSIGVRSAATIDLVAIGFSRREEDAASATELARRMMVRYPTLHAFADASTADLVELSGLDAFEVLRTTALMEIGRRSASTGKGPIVSIEGPADVMELLSYLRHEKREHFVAVLLDSKSGIMRVVNVHVGTLTMSLVGAREVFREAIREGASSLIVAHNHPSGDPTPSPEDVQITEQLVTIGDMLDIPVLDHVIIGERRFTSLKQTGLM